MNKPNPDLMKAFGGKLLGLYTGSILSRLIQIGYRTDLFEAAAKGPGTSHDLAGRAGLNERYVREWLGAMTTGGVFTYDPNSKHYTLPLEHAMMLTGDNAVNMAPMADFVSALTKPLDEVVDCFRNGGGVPYASFQPEFHQSLTDAYRRIYDQYLVTGYLDQAPGLLEKLKKGISVMDMGCGSGHAMNLLARAFPRSRVTGCDISEEAIATARAEARAMGLTNVEFHVRDATTLNGDGTFDLVTSFDAIHDQVDPVAYLRVVYDLLAKGGTFFAVEFKISSHLEKNMDNPFAPYLYGASTMHCMTVSLAQNGAGLGAAWGLEMAERMFAEAGFTGFQVFPAPRPQNCILISEK